MNRFFRLSVLWLVAIAAGCSDRRAPIAALTPEPALAVARERMLSMEDRDHSPLFGPDGAITVGSTRFSTDGHRSPHSPGAQLGQIRPIAMIGTAAHPETLALAWPAYPHPSGREVSDDGAWLIAGDPDARARTFTPTGIRFANEYEWGTGPLIELSPDRHAIVATEAASSEQTEHLVVRGVPAGSEIARISLPGRLSGRACWVDPHRIAWRDSPTTLATFDLSTRVTTRFSAPIGELAACAAGGGDAALVTPTHVAVIDLASARTRGTIELVPSATPTEEGADGRAPTDGFALRAGGCDVAMLRGNTLTVLQCEKINGATWYRTTLVHAFAADVHRPSRLAFSPDARRLALVGDSLVVLETSVPPRVPPALPAMTDLPHGFTAVTSGAYDGWSYAQLAKPTGLAPLPTQIIHAWRDNDDPADVVTIAMELDALSRPPPPADADDAAIEAYALAIMPELFDQWRDARVGTDRDADFTLHVGRREGRLMFETREAWRDGCEPYDGYTQVVIDRDLLFITRALVAPAASTNSWLQVFYDVPFQHRSQLARRRGPETGPC